LTSFLIYLTPWGKSRSHKNIAILSRTDIVTGIYTYIYTYIRVCTLIRKMIHEILVTIWIRIFSHGFIINHMKIPFQKSFYLCSPANVYSNKHNLHMLRNKRWSREFWETRRADWRHMCLLMTDIYQSDSNAFS